jgi:hypothetical protein
MTAPEGITEDMAKGRSFSYFLRASDWSGPAGKFPSVEQPLD